MPRNLNPQTELLDDEIEVRCSQFLLSNPAPKDLEVHAFASGLGINKDRVEEVMYRMLSTVLTIGLGWGLLDRDSKKVEALLYSKGIDTDSQVDELVNDVPTISPNMASLCLRMRHSEFLEDYQQNTRYVLSSVSPDKKKGKTKNGKKNKKQKANFLEEVITRDDDIGRGAGDTTTVNDSDRIRVVNEELTELGLTQWNIDTAIRILDQDGYSNESTLLNSSYASLREALVQRTDYVFDDPDFEQCAKLFKGADTFRQDYGQEIRIAKVRQACRMMRQLASRYGISNRGLSSSISDR